jgi:hypothetical protein
LTPFEAAAAAADTLTEMCPNDCSFAKPDDALKSVNEHDDDNDVVDDNDDDG